MLTISNIQNSSAVYIRHGNSNKEHIKIAEQFPAYTGFPGTLIAPQWLICAAHMPVPPQRIRIGDKVYMVVQWMDHPDFKGFAEDESGPTDYDVRLIQLSEPVENIKPIKIHQEVKLEFPIAWILGCGASKDERSTSFRWPDLITKRAGTNILIEELNRPIYKMLYSQHKFTEQLSPRILEGIPPVLLLGSPMIGINLTQNGLNNSEYLKSHEARPDFIKGIKAVGQAISKLNIFPPEQFTAFRIGGPEEALLIQSLMASIPTNFLGKAKQVNSSTDELDAILEGALAEFSLEEANYPITKYACGVLPGDSGGGIFVNTKDPHGEMPPQDEEDFYNNFELAAITSWGDMAFDEQGNIYGDMRATKLSDPDIYNWIQTTISSSDVPSPGKGTSASDDSSISTAIDPGTLNFLNLLLGAMNSSNTPNAEQGGSVARNYLTPNNDDKEKEKELDRKQGEGN